MQSFHGKSQIFTLFLIGLYLKYLSASFEIYV
jgi:hypothetical protein